MAQAYRTTYNINFRWRDSKIRTLSLAPRDKFAESLPPGDYWLVNKTAEEKELNQESVLAVQRLYNNRNATTYQKAYCKEHDIQAAHKWDDNQMSALLEYGSDLYSTKTVKLIPPLPSARRLYGYLSPRRMYTPLTTYQIHIGKLGYSLLKDNIQVNKSDDPADKDAEQLNNIVKDEMLIKTEYEKTKKKHSTATLPKKNQYKNYTVQCNGTELTISKCYNPKLNEIDCKCK